MNYEIPVPLKQEHEALHEQLRQAPQARGEVGELAETVLRLMHPHFVKEDQIVLPTLGLLAGLTRGEATPGMAGVLGLMHHARTEEVVVYPAAILVGKFVRQRLGQPKAAPVWK